MRKNFHGKARFWQGKGVYAALAAVLLALGAVGVATFSQSLFHTEPQDSSLPYTEPVEQPITNQPDDRTTTTTATTTATTTVATTTEPEEAPDLYILPVSNTVQKPYSPDKLLFSQTMGDWRTHGGVDFAGETGQGVKALANATVQSVAEDPMWGWIITLDHGVGVLSRYCGVTPSVRQGDEVEVGQIIGKLSAIPCESAQTPHLHLEMSVDGQAVDPVTALAKEVRYGDTTAE